MKLLLTAATGAVFALAGSAGAQGYNPNTAGHCPTEPAHYDGAPCQCTKEADFYGPGNPAGWGDIRVAGPGVRVYGRPVTVATGRIYVSAPPVYVDAPPVRIAAPQIYVQSPQVYVRPSNVTVEPPNVHFTGCAEGQQCATPAK